MNHKENSYHQSRRNFIKRITASGTIIFLSSDKLFSAIKRIDEEVAKNKIEYKFKTISVEHIKEVGRWIAKLKKDHSISENKTYRSYIDKFVYNSAEILPNATSLILVSIPQRISSINFHRKGKKYQILIPTGYVDDGLTYDFVKNELMKDIIKEPGKVLYEKVKLPLKTIAVRSGLAKYGRNNITYVDDYGSCHQLLGFYTDKKLEDNWGPLKMLHYCKGCTICIKNCPTKIISEEKFPINVTKCITLYNELADPFPDWIDPKAHNALVGCLKCQWDCPANDEAIKRIEKLADITEEETELILSKGENEKLWNSIIKKLERFPSAADKEYFSRNLSLVLANTIPE